MGVNSILENGTDNEALADSESVVVGSHLKGRTPNQMIIGRYNDITGDASADIFQIGSGTSDKSRANAFRVDKNGNPTIMGGEIYMDSSVGSITLRVPVLMESNNKIKKVYGT